MVVALHQVLGDDDIPVGVVGRGACLVELVAVDVAPLVEVVLLPRHRRRAQVDVEARVEGLVVRCGVLAVLDDEHARAVPAQDEVAHVDVESERVVRLAHLGAPPVTIRAQCEPHRHLAVAAVPVESGAGRAHVHACPDLQEPPDVRHHRLQSEPLRHGHRHERFPLRRSARCVVSRSRADCSRRVQKPTRFGLSVMEFCPRSRFGSTSRPRNSPS